MVDYPHAGIYPQAYWPDQDGNPTPGKQVGVYAPGTFDLATLYADRDRALMVQNPTTLTDDGNTQIFFAEPGTYDVRRIVAGQPAADAFIRISVAVDAEDAIDGPADVALDDVVLFMAASLPHLFMFGDIVRDDETNVILSAPLVQADRGIVGTFTTDTQSEDFPGEIDAYHVTFTEPVERTYTQPLLTRNAGGAVTTRPALEVT